MRAWWGVVALLAMEAALLAWTWQRWADPMIDFGRELAVAHGVAEGRLLYRDVAYFNGPLSPTVNAVWVRMFGGSILALALPNAALLGLLTVGIYRLILRAHGPLLATLIGAMFLSCFGLSQHVTMGNYNDICPYSHELTHGLLLSVGMLTLLSRRLRGGGVGAVAGAGCLAGLAFLTKAEVSLAVGAALAAFAILGWRSGTIGRRDATWMAAGFAAPVLAFAGYFLARGGVDVALQAIAGTWGALVRGRVGEIAFYQRMTGLREPGVRLAAMIQSAGATGLMVLSLVGLDFALRSRSAALGMLVALGLLGSATLRAGLLPYILDGPGLPLVALAAGAGYGVMAWDRGRLARLGPMVMLSAFAAAIVVKMGLNCTLSGYGFALAMPAGLVAASGAAGLLPEILKGRAGGEAGDILRRMAAVLLVADLIFGLRRTHVYLAQMTVPIGSGPDRLHAYAPGTEADGIVKSELITGREIQGALDFLKSRARSGDTMVVLPEGAMLNHLAGLRNPTPYFTFLPPEGAIFGEDEMRGAIETNPPDWVVWIHRNMAEYEVPPFGEPGFGERLGGFVLANYESVEEISDARPPGEWGVRVYAKRVRNEGDRTGEDPGAGSLGRGGLGLDSTKSVGQGGR